MKPGSIPLRLRKRVIAALPLALLPLIYFYPAVIGQVVLAPGDGWSQNLGVRVLVGRMIAQGVLPLWDPYIFAGTPLLASIQPGALYPPNWVFAFFPPGVAMNVVVITTYHLALIGAYLYARRIGVGYLGALVAGVIFAFSGYLVANAGQTNQLAASAWLPWVLLAIDHLAERGAWRWVALGALFIALQIFAGHPQTSFYTALLGGAYAAFLLITREGRAQRWRFVAAAAMMVLCGLLLSAVQLLPERELQQQGERAQLSHEVFTTYSLPPRQALAIIFPYLFGGAALPPYQMPYWGQWLVGITCSYVGMAGLLLALVAVLGERRKTKGESESRLPGFAPFAFRLSPFVSFWAGAAVVALVLAFGGYLPFGLYRLLFYVPGYNLFRAPYRHLLEFTFALAVLAGLGMDCLVRVERERARRALVRSVVMLAALVAGTLITYRFFGQYLETAVPRPAEARSLASPEVLVPLVFFALSVAALWLYVRRRTRLASAVLLTVMLVDLASFGHFFYWRGATFRAAERLADPPPVKLIKAREPDLNAFRVLSYISLPADFAAASAATSVEDSSFDLFDSPNITIARGLQSVNGYDPMRLIRVGEMTGTAGSVFSGFMQDADAVGLADQRVNLLNVKYLFLGRSDALGLGQGVSYEGIGFSRTTLNLTLGPGVQKELTPGGVLATELAVVSAMGRSTHVPDGAPVVSIKLHTKDGRVIERELQAGRDTAEWAYDRADVRPNAQHRRAPVVESYDAGEYQGHRYLARLAFDRVEVERIELSYSRPDADLLIVRASLYDAMTGSSFPLSDLSLPPERWRKLERFGPVEVYENLKLMPRAWFVRRLAVMPSAEVLRTIKEGKSSDGALFDPSETALLEAEDFGGRVTGLPSVGDASGAQVQVTRYEPQRIELETHNQQAGFLVLSEVYYPGWEARIDGQKMPVHRVDYTLRGMIVPAGSHHIEMIFHPPTFRAGAVCASLGVALLVAGVVVGRRRDRASNALSR